MEIVKNYAFVVMEVTALKYFFPFFEFCINKNVSFKIYCQLGKKKQTSFSHPENFIYLKPFFDKIKTFNDLQILYGACLEDKIDYLFTIDGGPFLSSPRMPRSWKLVVIPALYDFINLFTKYADNLDVFLSLGFYHDQFINYPAHVQVLYLGSPKFLNFNDYKKELICFQTSNKITPGKLLTIFAPNKSDILKGVWVLLLIRVCTILMGVKTVIKTRPKHNHFLLKLLGYRIFLEDQFFPPTSLLLLASSQACVIFDSSTFKEALIMEVPMINFNIKSYRSRLFPLDFFMKNCSDNKVIFDIKTLMPGPVLIWQNVKKIMADGEIDIQYKTQRLSLLKEKWFRLFDNSVEKIFKTLV